MLITLNGFAQTTLYVPEGVSGIGASSNNNVGVGTASPISKLTIRDINPVFTIESSDAGIFANDIVGKISVHTNESSINGIGEFASLRWISPSIWDHSINTNGELDFSIFLTDVENGVQDYKEVFRIVHTGDIGIGTTAPNAKLEVKTNESRLLRLTYNTNESPKLDFYGGESNINIRTTFGSNGASLSLGTVNKNRALTVHNGGFIGIWTENPEHHLDVLGRIRANEIYVDMEGVPDFVFDDKYNLKSLQEVEAYIRANKHLEGIPSAKEMEGKSNALGELNLKLLQKVEELTLYLIEQDKKIKHLENELETMKKQ